MKYLHYYRLPKMNEKWLVFSIIVHFIQILLAQTQNGKIYVPI